MTVLEAAAAARAWLEQVADSLAYGTWSEPSPAQVRDARVSIDPPAEVVEFVPPTSVRQVRPRLTFEAILFDGRTVKVVREVTDEQMARHR